MVTRNFQRRKRRQTEVTEPLYLEMRALLGESSTVLCSAPAFGHSFCTGCELIKLHH